jgi:AmmeMemoRadiSam system protein B
MQDVRQAAVAGRFYPADPEQLGRQIDQLLEEARGAVDGAPYGPDGAPDRHAGGPRALIAPHAGYVYSGPTAAIAFDTLAQVRAGIRRVVVIGPSHFVPFAGVALPEATVFRTPFGDLEVDAEGAGALRELSQVVSSAEPHRREHAVEVELPFLQTVLGDFSIVPLVTGEATAAQIAEALEALWDDDTLVVVSSDLSHFHDYDTARRLDAATARTIVTGDPQELVEGSACGRLAIQGLKIAARRRGMDMSLLDLRNSGDTAGPRDEVVGYGAFRADASAEA